MTNKFRHEFDIIDLVKRFFGDARDYVVGLLESCRSGIEKLLTKLFKSHVKSDETAFSDLNKRNRLKKALSSISKLVNNTYKDVVNTVNKAREELFIGKHMMMSYLHEAAHKAKQPFRKAREFFPGKSKVKEMLKHPVEYLRVPQLFESQRNETVRRLNIEIPESLRKGEGFFNLIDRVKGVFKRMLPKARTTTENELKGAEGIADEYFNAKYGEQYPKDGTLRIVWLAVMDDITRHAHRTLDGQIRDDDGFFHYHGMTARYPHDWPELKMNINCRCHVLRMVNERLPIVKEGHDAMDVKYQQMLSDRIDKYIKEGQTYLAAFRTAEDELPPPPKMVDGEEFRFERYRDWVEDIDDDIIWRGDTPFAQAAEAWRKFREGAV